MLSEKVKTAIERLRTFEPETEPYYLCYSGGKDSDCIRILAELAGVRFEIHHNLTTVDAPETIQYIRSIPGVIIDKAHYPDGSHKTMWNLIAKKGMPPTRIVRYCCTELKEQGGKGRMKVTGVRASESKKRADNSGLVKIIGKPATVRKTAENMGVEYTVSKMDGLILNYDNDSSRRFVEQCYRTTSTMLNPIIDWTEPEVWEFLHYYGCEGNPLYKCGRSRIGCIGCPMKSHKGMQNDFAQYPKYKKAYLKTFDRMLEVRKEAGKETANWETSLDVYKWWVGIDPDQLTFEGFEEF